MLCPLPQDLPLAALRFSTPALASEFTGSYPQIMEDVTQLAKKKKKKKVPLNLNRLLG